MRKTKSSGRASPIQEAVRRITRNAMLSYEEVAERVREEVPEARTTSKTVASIVRLLRKAGVAVPDRRIRRSPRSAAKDPRPAAALHKGAAA